MGFVSIIVKLLFVVGWTWFAFWYAGKIGIGRELINHTEPYKCDLVRGVLGPEDLVSIGNGLFLISAFDRRSLIDKKPLENGGVFVWDAKTSVKTAPRRLKIVPESSPFNSIKDINFEVHGLSLYKNPQTSKLTLLVMNHGNKRETIEIFEIISPENSADIHLKFIKTIWDEKMTHINDVAAISETQFYVSHDTPLGGVEMGLLLPTGGASYWNGTNFIHGVVSGLRFGNGIFQDPKDSSIVYVAASIDASVFQYKRNPSTGALTLIRAIPVRSGVDNIDFDEDGSMWLGCHSSLLKFFAHAAMNTTSPSQVIRVDAKVLRAQSDEEMEKALIDGLSEVYADEGKHFSCSSVAAPFHFKTQDGRQHDGFTMGQVFNDGVLYCERH